MPDITAKAPDGSTHNFPDGTDPAVVDRVMKRYITGGAGAAPAPPGGPAAATPTTSSAGGAPTPLTPRSVGQDIVHFGSEAWSEAKGMAKGLGEAASAPPQTPIDRALGVMGQVSGTNPLALKRLLVDPAIEKGKSTVQALRSGEWMKAGLGAAATLNPMAPDVTKLYEQSESGDTVGAAGRGFTDIMALKGLDLVKDAVKLIDRAPSIEQGKTGYVTQARRAVNLLDHKISEQGVGARANQVIAADATHNAQTQSPGYVNGAAVTNAMTSTMQTTGMGANVAPQINAQMTMQQAKVMMTQLGRQAASLDRAGKAPEAAVTWSGYDALRDETMKRARALDTLQPGAGHAQAWGDYAKEFKEHLKVIHGGPLGAMMEGDPVKALDKLIEGEGVLKGRDVAGKRIVGADNWFKKYGVDFTPITDAIKQGKVLNDLSDYTSNALMGKIKMIARHPIVGIPMIMAESKLFSGMHVGGLGTFVLPLIIAAKVGKVLDHIQIHKILVDIGKHMPAEDMSLSAEPLGPHDAMTGPIGPGGPGAGGGAAGGPPAPGAGGGAGGLPTAPAPGTGGVPAANIPPDPFAGGLANPNVAKLAPAGAKETPAFEGTRQGVEAKWKDATDTYEQELAGRLKQARKSKGNK